MAERFPDEDAFDAALPEVLRGLGFVDNEAEFLGTRIDVEIARGAGHAVRPALPEFHSWLRTNRLPDTLGWDGFAALALRCPRAQTRSRHPFWQLPEIAC